MAQVKNKRGMKKEDTSNASLAMDDLHLKEDEIRTAGKKEMECNALPVEEESRGRRRTAEDEDDFFIDESIVRLLSILLPRMKWVIGISLLAAVLVGGYLFFLTPRMYVCSATIAPDVMKDFTSIDLLRMTSTDSDSIPIISQLSQLKTLVESTQVKREIIEDYNLDQLWGCETSNACLKRLSGVYSTKELRNVGLELEAKATDPDLSLTVVNAVIETTNSYYSDIMQKKAESSIQQLQGWINSVTNEINLISSEYIRFASEHNITDLESQFRSGTQLLGELKASLVNKEVQLREKLEELTESSVEILTLKASIEELKDKISRLVNGTDPDDIYPPLSDYESLKQTIQGYQQQLSLLRNRLELFNKQVATAQIEMQKQPSSIMVLDEPLVEPAGKGTVKFSILAFIGIFFFACIALVMYEYWNVIKSEIQFKQ
jgi:uncharacterized coiled-coil protein SlyX